MEAIGHDVLVRLYELMVSSRTLEEQLLRNGETTLAASLGEEAVGAGVCVHLGKDDYIATTHRPMNHYVSMGLDLNSLVAEILGKRTGICGGKAGYMHIIDVAHGVLGAYAIVGENMPLALGPALAHKIRGTRGVSVVFFGDGAANQGTTHEAMNLASVWNLPVLFVCQNNRYAGATPVEYACSIENIADRAQGYSMPGQVVDGQDVFSVYHTAAQLIERSRNGNGPSLLECKTYRYTGHYAPGDDDLRYRTSEEVESYKERDCIQRFKDQVMQSKWLDQSALEEIEARARDRVDEAIALAKNAPEPEANELVAGVYRSR